MGYATSVYVLFIKRIRLLIYGYYWQLEPLSCHTSYPVIYDIDKTFPSQIGPLYVDVDPLINTGRVTSYPVPSDFSFPLFFCSVSLWKVGVIIAQSLIS